MGKAHQNQCTSQSCQSNCEQPTGGTQGQLELDKWSLDAAPPPFFNHGHMLCSVTAVHLVRML
jgi:hypothetical protein